MKKTILFLFAALLCLCLCACAHENVPYEPDTPLPPAHSGTFVSEHGTMTFSGDGESVVIDFDAYLAELTGLPEGEHAGTYVFLSGELPPNGSVPVRYDAAHELKLTVDGQSVVIGMGLAAADGKTAQVGVNVVTPERIPMLFSDDGSFSVVFQLDAE